MNKQENIIYQYESVCSNEDCEYDATGECLCYYYFNEDCINEFNLNDSLKKGLYIFIGDKEFYRRVKNDEVFNENTNCDAFISDYIFNDFRDIVEYYHSLRQYQGREWKMKIVLNNGELSLYTIIYNDSFYTEEDILILKDNHNKNAICDYRIYTGKAGK